MVVFWEITTCRHVLYRAHRNEIRAKLCLCMCVCGKYKRHHPARLLSTAWMRQEQHTKDRGKLICSRRREEIWFVFSAKSLFFPPLVLYPMYMRRDPRQTVLQNTTFRQKDITEWRPDFMSRHDFTTVMTTPKVSSLAASTH